MQKPTQAPVGASFSSPPSQNTAPTSSPSITERGYTYYKDIFKDRPFPFAYLDLDLLDHNIRQIASRAQGKRVRLASKSLRSVAVLRRILAADPCFQGIMCYTPREAVYLSEQGLSDLLMGYPTGSAHDLAAIAQATAAGAQITLMIDSIAHVEQAEAAAQQYGVRLPLCLDIDMSLPLPGLHFGVWRTPLRTPEQARPVIERIVQSSHVWLDGIMGYEAQVAGLGDNYPGQTPKNMLVRFLKQRSLKDFVARRAALVELVKTYGQTLRFVNGGGTGSILTTRDEPAVTEITVGSGFYAPTLFDNYHDFRYQPAAGYAIQVVRRPRASLYTCQGGGYTASGVVGPDKQAQPYLPHGARLDPMEGAGEVQTPIWYDGPEKLDLGDPVFMRHAKAGELCERFTHLLCVSNGAIVDKITTYRGDGQCFL